MQQVSIKLYAKGEVPKFDKHPLRLNELWVMESSTDSGRSTVAFHFTDHKNEEFCCETTARIADGMSGAIVTAQLQFGQKPLGAQEGIDYFGLFHRMKEKLRDLYFKVPGATTEEWAEYSKDIIIDKLIEV